MRALHTAATGMMAQELNVEVISNNIANMRTSGYKRQRAEVQDCSTRRPPGRLVDLDPGQHGAGRHGGRRRRAGTVGTPRMMSRQGLADRKELDVAIRGEGLFRIVMPDGAPPTPATGPSRGTPRAARHPAGQCAAARHHHPREPPVVTISQQGQSRGSSRLDHADRVRPDQLSRFVNKTGLQAIGNNLFVETADSGTPQDGAAAADGPRSQQGNLEQANVEAVTEISDLIAAQRAYEMNSKVISAADQMLQATANLMR